MNITRLTQAFQVTVAELAPRAYARPGISTARKRRQFASGRGNQASRFRAVALAVRRFSQKRPVQERVYARRPVTALRPHRWKTLDSSFRTGVHLASRR